MTIHSYPWYIADWRGSEAVLSMNLEQRGLYRELLDHCWDAGSLPTDEAMLRRLASAEPAEFKRSWPAVRHQFYEKDGRLYHRKVDEKRGELGAWREAKREAGRLGAQRRWHKQGNSSSDGTPNGSPNGSLNGSPNGTPNGSVIATSWPSSSSSSSTSSTTTTKEENTYGQPPISAPAGADACELPFELSEGKPPARPALVPNRGRMTPEQSQWFESWWSSYWRKVSRKPAAEAFRIHVKTEARFQAVMEATRRQTATMMAREPDKRPHGASWLNAERWNDEPAPAAKPPGKLTVVERTEALWAERIAKGQSPL